MPDYGVGSWPSRRARIDGAGVALRQAGRSLTYAQLADRVERIAQGLAASGVGHGERVAYLGLNDIATFEVFFAAGRLGALFVPINTRLSADEVSFVLDDARPSVLVHGAEAAELVAGADPSAHGVHTVIRAGARSVGNDDGLAALIESSTRLPSVRSQVEMSDDAVILYTSGTTGRPKGAVLTHANLTFNTINQLAHVDVLSSDTALCMCPLFHATGLGQVSLPTLFKGGTTVVLPKFDAATVLDLIGELGIASFSAVPTMLQMMCDHPDFGAAELSSLRYAIYGGSMVAERVALAWQERGVAILQGYGMTEASPGVYLAPENGASAKPVSIGVPHFFTDVSLDATGAPPAPGERGELHVRGPHVFRGYWERPADTDAASVDGWFRTGDVLRIDEDGWAYVVDRIKDMIISGGENIYPAEVEAVVNALPGVIDCSVIAEPDERWGEVGLAFVIAEPGAWDEASLRDALRPGLAAFKIPKHVRFVPDLPRTATGKVRKQDLRNAATRGGTP